MFGGADEALVALDGLAGIDPYADPIGRSGWSRVSASAAATTASPQATAWRAR